jgi:hypothetical protein
VGEYLKTHEVAAAVGVMTGIGVGVPALGVTGFALVHPIPTNTEARKQRPFENLMNPWLAKS